MTSGIVTREASNNLCRLTTEIRELQRAANSVVQSPRCCAVLGRRPMRSGECDALDRDLAFSNCYADRVHACRLSATPTGHLVFLGRNRLFVRDSAFRWQPRLLSWRSTWNSGSRQSHKWQLLLWKPWELYPGRPQHFSSEPRAWLQPLGDNTARSRGCIRFDRDHGQQAPATPPKVSVRAKSK